MDQPKGKINQLEVVSRVKDFSFLIRSVLWLQDFPTRPTPPKMPTGTAETGPPLMLPETRTRRSPTSTRTPSSKRTTGRCRRIANRTTACTRTTTTTTTRTATTGSDSSTTGTRMTMFTALTTRCAAIRRSR